MNKRKTGSLIVMILCSALLSKLVDRMYQWHIVQDVKSERWNPLTKEWEPHELYPLGYRSTPEDRKKELSEVYFE